MKLITTTETITPAVAREWLKRNGKDGINRPVNDTRVTKYGCDMLDNNWVVNGESIKFSSRGELIDGQHRLLACIEADTAFTSLVVHGIEDEGAFATIDVGETRTHGDIFHIAGFKDSNLLAGVAMIVFHYESRKVNMGGIGTGRTVVTKQELLEFARKHATPMVEAATFARSSAARKLIPPTMVGALRYLCGQKSISAAETFLTMVGDGVGLGKTDAAYWLREKLIANAASTKEKLSRAATLALCITAWNKFRAGETVRQLKMPDTFPRIK